MTKLQILADHEDASQSAAQFVADLAHNLTASQGRFTIALSGASTPRRLHQLLASPPLADGIAWDRWHVFWGDERCVPADHDDSNYRMARETLLDRVPIPDSQIHRMRGEAVPGEAAEEYEQLILNVFHTPVPCFDLILLGIGDDGHTASLFPGSEALQEQERLVVSNWAPELRVHRITFTLPLINAAKTVAFLDTGESKAEVLRSVLEPHPGEYQPPAALVQPSQGTTHWFLTEKAARLLTKPHGYHPQGEAHDISTC